MTKEERHLWYDFLRTYPVQFNRQKVIGNYIADFNCDKVKLVVELDGSQHYGEQAQQYDTKRSEYMRSLGIHVLRFTNLDIQQNFAGICEKIDTDVKGRL